MKRRGLFVHTTQGTRLTGGPRMLRTLLAGLRGGPLEPTLVTQRPSDLTGAVTEDGVPVVILSLPAGLELFGAKLTRPGTWAGLRAAKAMITYHRAFGSLLREIRPAVVWTTNLRTLLTVGPACRLAGVPVVWNIWLGQPSRGLLVPMNGAAIRLADRIVTEYESQAAELFNPRQLQRARSKLRTVHTGHEIPNPPPRAPRAPGAPIVIGTLGSISPRKNPRAFLEMAVHVRREIPDARFVVGGEGAAPGLVPLREELQRFAASAGLENAVEWVGWTDDPLALLARLDVYVQTSRAEGLPGAVREAMACALPVVATDVGGTRDAVVPGETGFLAAPDDVEGLARAVVRLARDADLAARLGGAGRQRFERHFTGEAFVRNTRDVLEEAASLHGR